MNDTDAVKARVAKLYDWSKLREQLAALKDREETLRRELFADFFPAAEEGVNDEELGEGYVLKGTYKINRKLDEAALPAILKMLPASVADKVIHYKPGLVLAEYRKLKPVHKKILDEVVTASPGLPTLEIVAPKKKEVK